jgi:molecular chaperone DnaK
MAHENTSLGRFMLTNVAPAPKGVPHIEITFKLDVNGIVQVTAMDQATGCQRNITVRTASGLTHSQVDKARTEQQHQITFDDGMNERDKIVGQLRRLTQSMKKTFTFLSAKLAEVERSNATGAFSQAEQAKDGSLEEVQAALWVLETTAEALGQAKLHG